MTRQTKNWTRNIEGLRATAQKRADAARNRVEEALQLLLREQRPINFKSVAETAQVSTAWLYQHDDIKQRIAHLRGQQSPKPKTWMPPQTRASDTSKDHVIRTLTERLKRVEAENEELRRALKVAWGYKLSGDPPPETMKALFEKNG
jgi:Family of unknown function (DUF6262)